MIYQANDPLKKAGVATLVSDKVDVKPKLVQSNKEGHFIIIKGAIHEEEITMVEESLQGR
jgi:hypothetical protein